MNKPVGKSALVAKGRCASRPPNSDLRPALAGALKQFREILDKGDFSSLNVGSISDLYKLTVSFSALARAQLEAERWECERHGLLEEARRQLIEQVRAQFLRHPRLLEEVQKLIAETSDSAESLLE